MRAYTQGGYENEKEFTALDYVRYLRVYLKLYQTWIQGHWAICSEHADTQLLPVHALNKNARLDDTKSEDWLELWNQLHPAVQRY